MRKNILAKAILLATAAAASGSAFAQEVKPAANEEAAAEATSLDIIVTATRRSERLQNVPLAITAVSGQTVSDAGVKNLNDVQYITPGLTVGDTPSDRGFRVRGVGSLTGTYINGKENPVGVVVDNVIQGMGAGFSALFDIDHIEVLKGPQGTQFGKNAAAGVVNIITARPQMDRASVRAYASYATGELYDVNGTVNLPLSSIAAIRVNGFGKGYGDFLTQLPSGNGFGGQHEWGGRAKLLVTPSDSVEILISGDYSHEKINSGSQLWTVNASSVAQAGVTYGVGNRVSREPLLGKQDNERWGLSAEINLDLGDYRLTSVTSYRKSKEVDFGGFGSGFPAFGIAGADWMNDFNYNKSQTTQEIRLTSPKGKTIEFVAGYLYYRQPTRSLSTGGVAIPGVTWIFNVQQGLQAIDISTASHGLFADGKVRLSESTALLFGARYTHDKVSSSFADGPFDGGDLNTPYSAATYLPSSQTSATGQRFTWKAGIEHKFSKDVMAFASVSTGYLGPIINYRFSSGLSEVLAPQTNTNYTLGFKAQFLDRQVTLNANAFIDDYVNFQTGYFNTSRGVQFVGENAGKLTNKGVEAELNVNLRNGVRFGGSFAYVHSRFGDYCSGGTTPSASAPACTTPRGFSGGRLDGFAPPGTPAFTSNLFVGYEKEVGSNLKFSGNASFYYRSSSRNSPDNALTEVKGYGLTNLNFFLGSPDDKWRAGFYVRNLFDKKFASAVMSSSFGAPGTYVNWVTRQSLRTIGGSVEFKF